MVKRKAQPEGSARERIISTAVELFYQQGYRATGINEVIDKSEVAKATFYKHFRTKDELCSAYLAAAKTTELATIDAAIDAAGDPLQRFMAPMETVRPWLKQTNYRGCGFINIAAEVPDPKSPLRRTGIELYDAIEGRVERLAAELIASDKDQYGHLDPRVLSKEYMVAFGGAVALAQIYHDIWPIEDALKIVRSWLGQ